MQATRGWKSRYVKNRLLWLSVNVLLCMYRLTGGVERLSQRPRPGKHSTFTLTLSRYHNTWAAYKHSATPLPDPHTPFTLPIFSLVLVSAFASYSRAIMPLLYFYYSNIISSFYSYWSLKFDVFYLLPTFNNNYFYSPAVSPL